MSLRSWPAACAQMLLLLMVMATVRFTAAIEEETATEDEAHTEGWFTKPSEFVEEKDLKCPELDPYVASPCAFLCGSCPKGQVCCRNNCGGTECMEPAKPHMPSEKEDFTERPEGWDRRDIITPMSIHPENNPTCPPVHLNLSLPCDDFLPCEDSGSCSDDKICCPNDCGGRECMYHVTLPVIDHEDFTERPEGWDRREIITTMNIRPEYNPTCPPVHLNLSLPCEDSLLCENDGSCSEDKICCPNDCGGAECIDHLIMGTVPPIDQETKIPEGVSETGVPENQPPPPSLPMNILRFLMFPPGFFCPKLDPKTPIRCTDMCNLWTSGCPRGQVCCLNSCGAGECRDADYKEGPEMHENKTRTPTLEELYDEVPEPEYDESPVVEWSPLCPKPDLRDTQPCRSACSPGDDSCPVGLVCCRNKCGYGECKVAVAEEQPDQKEKEKLFWELYAKNTIHQYEKNVVD